MEWLSSEPNPRTSGLNAAGGWKLHAVGDDKRALCGLRAKHGWGTDLFVEDKCRRCAAALKKCEQP